MSNKSAAAPVAEHRIAITEAEIDRARSQVGIPQPDHVKRHDARPSAAGIAHFAFSLGDDNPLWHDPEYGSATRWRRQIGSPTYLTVTGVNETPKFTAERKRQFRHLFPGAGEYVSGQSWEWYRPVSPGDDIYYDIALTSVHVVQSSKFTGGQSVHMITRDLYADHTGGPVGMSETLKIASERSGSKKTNRHAGVELWPYTDEDIAAIDAIYAAEEVRGAVPRYWEDVEVGDALQPLAKGPLTVTDIIAEHLGRGMGHYGHGPLRFQWKTRQKIGGFYAKNSHGVPDVVQRLHWEHERAQEIGLPLAYDYGDMRMNWLTHLVTNWMGDDGWLWKLTGQMRAFNFIGDWHLMEGTVRGKRQEGRHCIVELEIKGTSQRDWVTCPGTAVVILPSRQHGPVVLPEPSDALRERGAGMMTEAAQRRRAG